MSDSTGLQWGEKTTWFFQHTKANTTKVLWVSVKTFCLALLVYGHDDFFSTRNRLGLTKLLLVDHGTLRVRRNKVLELVLHLFLKDRRTTSSSDETKERRGWVQRTGAELRVSL